VALDVNLEEGQKTGFYLDQSANTQLLVQLLKRSRQEALRVLDLCSYVGQWSVQIAAAFEAGKVDVTLVDASAAALELAVKNVERYGAKAKGIKADVIGGLGAFEPNSFDVVIADPPALIKGRKALGPGKHAYLQLNTDALKLVKPGGWIASCSCSNLLEEGEFVQTLGKAARRAGKNVQWIARGGHASDHPVLAEFPEGHYLKCWIGRVS
jgi:23S rRNA (cytosine1962-C5)-methyltransferase